MATHRNIVMTAFLEGGDEAVMKLHLPGLLRERLPSGNYRYRVRVEGNPRKRIVLTVGPDHKAFLEHYHAARAGLSIKPEADPLDNTIRGSVAWLVEKYFQDMTPQVEAGIISPLTEKRRRHLLTRLRESCGEYSLNIPPAEIIKIRDSMAATPAAADSMIKTIRALYAWAVERGICELNPAKGIGKIDRGRGGATPWTLADLETYRSHHRPGTTPHLALTLLLFTACRIGDAALLGRGNEFVRDGVRGLAWQPRKRGSAPVEIPMLPQLYEATRAITVLGPTYLLTAQGRPFSTPDVLSQTFSRWCREAGLANRSAHGIRKAAGQLLAQHGASQYQIMAIHGHTEAQTSEIYTKSVDRWKLALEAMRAFEGIEW